MVRTCIAHVLVGVLLGCPFPCLAKAAGTASAGLWAHGGNRCCCCNPGSKADKHRRPASEPCGSGTCLCHGAVLERPAPPPTLDIRLVSVLLADELIEKHLQAILDNQLNPSACDFASVCSGRILRAHIESLLL